MTRPNLLDVETMFDSLMTEIAPDDVTPIQEQHADSYDEVPFVSWTAINQGQYAHGLWNVTLVLAVVAEPTDLFRICSELYSGVQGWAVPGVGVLAAVGGVNTVTDGGVFDKVSEVRLPGKHLAQANATFQLTIQDMS